MTISTLHVRHEKRQPTHTLTHAHTLYFLSLCLSLCWFSSLLFEEKGTAARERARAHTHTCTHRRVHSTCLYPREHRTWGGHSCWACRSTKPPPPWLALLLFTSSGIHPCRQKFQYYTHILYTHAVLYAYTIIRCTLNETLRHLQCAWTLRRKPSACTVMGDMSDMS